MTSNHKPWSKSHITIWNHSIFLHPLKVFGWLILFALFQSPFGNAEDIRPPTDLTTFDHADEANGTLVFSAPPGTTPPKPLKVDLFDVKYLGTLRPPEGAPYFLVSANPCKTCQNEQAIYAVRPNDRKPIAFVYPGKILDPKTRALLLESRAFFGRCLPSHSDVYIVFQQERVDRRSRLQPSVLIDEAAKDHLNETLVDRHAPQLRTALQQVKRKQCQEIVGRNRLMLSRPLDLHPHADLGDDDDGDDEINKKKDENIGDQRDDKIDEPLKK